ncbi:zinc ribbon domain-containing protein [Candidatus Thorarchaeota archaeon]|nr:MAG: zinc ribbon domain-containing protein [Candidatus Thorarchaeota archaeon]
MRFLRNCEKCGKANQPTRKFCIRCGASLLKPIKEKPASIPTPAPVAPRPQPLAAERPTGPPTPTTDDKWVKPSEVSRDRVRAASGHKQKSELEKAREAFAKAETVGIDEADGSGVVESRMLRASEVKELLEGPGMMRGEEEIPTPTMMEGSEPLPPEAAEMMRPAMPTSSQIEESILGSKSAFVEKPKKVLSETTPPVSTQDETRVSPELSAEFSSKKYESVSEDVDVVDTEEATGFTSHVPPSEVHEPKKETFTPDDIDLVITCPDCGKTISVDMFEYPREVYSAMASARLKQARFFIVQGKGNEALRIVRMANALYTKAGDNKGLEEVRKIIEALAKKD